MQNQQDWGKRAAVGLAVLVAGAWSLEMLVTGGHGFAPNLWGNDLGLSSAGLDQTLCIWGRSTEMHLAQIFASPAAALSLAMALARHQRWTAVATAPATMLDLSRRTRPGKR